MNDKLIEVFSNLAIYEDSLKRVFPAKAYRNAVKLLQEFPEEIISSSQLKGIKGFGDKILTKIDLFLKDGTFPRYEEYLNSDIAKCKEIASIKGIGINKAKELFDSGIKSIDDLINAVANIKIGDPIGSSNVNYTKAISVGLQYRAHTNSTRMTVGEHDEVANPILDELKSISFIVSADAVGSRRRFDGSSNYTIGDIDIIMAANNSDVDKLQHILERMLDEVVMSGKTKVSGIKNKRQVDFRIVNPDQYGSIILHATGPMSFNVECRKIAIEKNMILNEYGLFDRDSNICIESKDEAAILKKLGIDWIDPKDRKNFKKN